LEIPKYHEFMLPILKALSNGNERSMSEIKSKMADDFKISDDAQKELLPSGNQSIFENRVGWAKTYLKKAGLVDSPRRGFVIITPRGMDVLKEKISEITPNYLKKFSEFLEFQNTSKPENFKDEVQDNSTGDQTPSEQFELAYKKLKDSLKNELIDLLLSCSPFFFEKLVVDLLLNLGYGGSKKEAGEAFSTTGDEGIDGIIKEDKLGLDLIYIQAKRWKKDSCVGRPEIQKFAGALQGKRAKKGIFITTSYYSSEAKEFVKHIDAKIILIDGDMLTDYMIESNTGVSIVSKYEIKKIDSDYFNED
jgi:restriction system protein